MYYLSVIASNCTMVDSVFVEQEADAPTAIAQSIAPSLLTCTVLSVQLDATSSTGGPNLSFLWSGNVSDPTSPEPIVAGPGIYEVTVTNLDNGCTDTDAVEIFQNIEVPIANAGMDSILSCQTPVIMLDGSASTPTGNLAFQWSAIGGGNFVTPTNIPNPQVNLPDAYQLTVTNLTNGCTDTDLVGISNDQSSPLAVINILPPTVLNCVTDTVFLNGSNSQNLQDVTFEWIGNIAEGQGTPLAAVTQVGQYSLALLNTLTGCTDTTTVNIGSNYNTPVADAGIGPDAITCTDMTEDIGGDNTSFGANITYQWTSSPGGAFVPGTDKNRLTTVTAPGTYYLTVTNIVSGCTAVDSVVVDDAIEELDAIVNSLGVLTCDDLSFQLDASASVIPPNASYRWQNSAGTVLVAGDLFFTVNYTDSFYFILNLGNCRDTALAVVTGIDSVPYADAGPDMYVDCNTNQATLNGGNSDTGANFTYQWSAMSSGAVVTGGITVSPVVQGVGFYKLEVKDNITGCSTFDTVEVLLDTLVCMPIANAGSDGSVGCAPSMTTLNASGSAGPNFSYQWIRLPGTILPTTGFNPLVGAGTYVFCVTNNAVALTACDTVFVAADTIPPIANIDPFLLALSCPELETCYALNVAGTSQGPNITYEWASLSGTFCTAENILNAEILGTGTYELFVTNTSNGCTAIDNIIVQLADTLVNAEINAAANIQIACGETEVQLTGLVEPQSGNLSYQWSTPGGEVISGANSLTSTVNALNAQDVFYFTVTNNINQCTDIDSIIVFAPVNCKPACGIAPPMPIDCNNSTVTLTAVGSATGPFISYQWTTAFGNFCGDNTSYSTCVDEGGLYSLTVFWTYPNGAVFDSSCAVTVQDLRTLPNVEAGPNDDLNCVDETLRLNGSGSATGTNITYQWTTLDGNIINGETTLAPEVDEVGTYELTVTNNATGCFSTDFVEIGRDINYPDAEAGINQLITCANSTVTLDGMTSLSNAIFLWTTNDGNINSNPNMEDVTVGAAGIYYFTVTNPVNGCSTIDSVQVDANGDIPTVNVGGNLNYTCADTIFTIPAIITNQASGALDFSWTSADGCFVSPTDMLQPTVNCPGTYELTVVDLVTSCSSTATVFVFDETTPPTADAGDIDEIDCDHLTLQLDGSNSTPANFLNFEWSTNDGNILLGQTTATPTINEPGLYKVVVTNQFNQCQDSATVVITIDATIPAVSAGLDTTLTCTRLDLNLDGTGSANGTGIVYEWTGPGIVSGANGLQPLINMPGEYVLEVTDTNNGCVVTDTVEVGTNTTPPNSNITAPQNLLITCDMPTLPLSGASSVPSGNISYRWTTATGKIENGVNSVVATISSGGIYTLTVTDLNNGCTNQESITVNENLNAPFLQVLPAHPLTCDSMAVQLRAIPPTPQNIYSFQWSGPGQILNDDTATPTVFEVGVYNVTITDETNGCTGDTIVAVTQDVSPPTAVASSIGELDCDDLTATVTGNGSTVNGVTYLWTTFTSGNLATPNAMNTEVDAAGTYFLTVKKLSNGCMAMDSTVVVANSIPIDSVHLSFQQPDCIDFEGFIFIDSVFGGTPPYTYSLNDSVFVTYPQFSYLDPGSYDFLVEGVNGCSWETTVAILYPNEILVELGDDIYISQGQSADLLAQISSDIGEIANIVWTNLPDSVVCPQCLDQVVTPYETSTYHIQVFDTTGCFGTDNVTVFVDEQNPFFVPTAFTPNGDNVNDRLIFYAGKDIEKVPEFSIYDRWGNRVFHQENFQPNNPSFGWDGYFEGQPMRPAVFAWKAWVEFKDGKRKVFYGDLTLVR